MQTRVVAAQLSHGIRFLSEFDMIAGNVALFGVVGLLLCVFGWPSFDVPLDSSMAGLVEAWALGTPWSSILGTSC